VDLVEVDLEIPVPPQIKTELLIVEEVVEALILYKDPMEVLAATEDLV
jgi:hypothetical protein